MSILIFCWGDLGYLGEEMFIMKRMGNCEVAHTIEYNLIRAYNTIHVKYGMQLKWGIGGLKRKWIMEMIYEKNLIPQN